MNTPIHDPEEPEPVYPQTPISAETEAHLSRAYQRILRVAIVLSVAAVVAALAINWRSGVGVAIGAALGLINFIWLHSSTGKLVDRLLLENKKPPLLEPPPDPSSSKTKFRFIFPFPLRYLLMIGVAYVILKSYPQLLIGFLIGLLLPLLASMVEGVYEAVAIGKTHQTSD
jgi:ATP synthase I chain